MPLTLSERDELDFFRQLLRDLAANPEVVAKSPWIQRQQARMAERVGYLEQLSTRPRMQLAPANTSTEN